MPQASTLDQHVVFVGVDGAGSSAMTAVPRWSSYLGHPVGVRAVDVPVGAPRARYIEVFEDMQSDPGVVGAVITCHKVGMYTAIADRCRFISPEAKRLRSCTVLATREAGIAAYASDVRSIGAELDRIWRLDRGTVACLGAGGSAAALCLHLLRSSAQPRRIVVCERASQRATEFRELFTPAGNGSAAELEVLDGNEQWDELVGSLPAESLVVNATGLGKTSAESPLTDTPVFPRGGTVWDLNYRGPLTFLAQARERRGEGELTIHDGSRLFAVGWLAALCALFEIDQTDAIEDSFVAIAQEVRG